MNKQVQILIADDHTMFADGLGMILTAYPGMNADRKAANGHEVLACLRERPADVVLMDINMPLLNGYETTMQVSREFPEVKIIALSMLSDRTSVMKMLEAGARGYIFKNAGEQELLEAIRTVTQDGYYVTADMQDILAQFLRMQRDREKGYAPQPHQVLSRREIEILKLVLDGYTNNDIAAQLFLSNRTVDTHRKNILSKLGLKNTAALVRYAVENKAFLGLE